MPLEIERPSVPSTSQIRVVLIIMVVFALLKSRLSADKPGKLQLTFEAIYGFVAGQAHDAVEHGSKYVPFADTHVRVNRYMLVKHDKERPIARRIALPLPLKQSYSLAESLA